MIKIYTVNFLVDAHILKGLLESQGIKCEVKGEYLFGARGELPITPETAPSVWILDETKINEAKAIVQGFESSLAEGVSNNDDWICKSCGEESESQFTECWNCGSPREFVE